MRGLKLAVLFLFVAGARLCLSTNETAQTSAPPAAVSEKMPANGTQWRDPFWPIGFVPPSVPRGSVLSGSDQDKESSKAVFDISNMLRIGCVVKKGDKFYAVINGFTVQTGEVVVAVTDSDVYKFVVEEIGFKKVQLRPVKK